MTDAPPSSLLITPDSRRRLQQRYEEAVRLAAQQPVNRCRVHELLAECLRTDPGSILYLGALLANLRQWAPQATWPVRVINWLRYRRGIDSHTPHRLLTSAPELLRNLGDDSAVLRKLAQAAGDYDFDEVELRYLQEARRLAPDDAETLRQLARALTRQGRFEEAVGPWFAVLALQPDAEANRAVEDLKRAAHASEIPAAADGGDVQRPDQVDSSLAVAAALRSQGRLAAAEHHLTQAQHAAGGDLRILALREDLRLAHSQERLAIARARALSDSHPKAQALVGRMEQEHNRLEIDILHVRSERHPDDRPVRLELARRLKLAGNYSGAIQRLEEALADPTLAAEANLELGECWQHLRQYDKALEFYRRVIGQTDRAEDEAGLRGGKAPADPPLQPLAAALYRLGVLAAAMNDPHEARAALERLVAIDPNYKDARQRLDKLP